MKYEYISWSRFSHLCGTLYRRINDSAFRPDMIIAVERGGYPVARLLSDYFDIMDLVGIKVEHYRGPEKMPRAVIPYPLTADLDGRRLLVVDDVSDSGDTFDAVLPHLRERGRPSELRTAVLHHKQTSSYRPDFHAQRVLEWRWITYPWAVVEDLTVVASRMDPRPATVQGLRRHLQAEAGLDLPAGVLRQVAPIVLDRLADHRPDAPGAPAPNAP
jgi:hypoxanthine phosphoribosyltransferase